MSFFLEEWRKNFPGSVDIAETALNDIVIEFDDTEKRTSGYTNDGEYIRNAVVSGLTYTRGMAWVKTSPGDRICQTSFIHELVHLVLWYKSDIHGDPDHEGDAYDGWSYRHTGIIDSVNRRLCELGV